jgi:hypothetical protein
MHNESKKQKASSNIGTGLACLVSGATCLYFDYVFWGWFLLAVGAYGLVTGILQPRLGYEKATNVAMVTASLVVVIALFVNFITKTRPNWTLALSWVVIGILSTLAIYSILSFIKPNKARFLLKSLLVTVFAVGLIVIFHFYAQNLFPLNAILIFLGTGGLRQGLHELFTGRAEESLEETGLIFLADVLVIALLMGGLLYYRELLFFHMLIITLVLALFRFSVERFIPEVAAREHQKIDTEYSDRHKRSFSFFTSLTGFHASINLLMLPLLLGYLYLSFEQYVAKFAIQSDVFQASISLLGIIAGFSALVLGERLRKSKPGWDRQTYLLRGLLGIAFLFSIIAMVAFAGMTLSSIVQQASLPTADEIVTQFLTSITVRSQVIAALTNEFTFFAIPAALLYFFFLSRDLVERFRRISNGDGSDD